MKKINKETKLSLLKKDSIEDYIRFIGIKEKVKKEIDFTEKDISYQELKKMYLERVNKYRELEELLREKTKPRNVLKPHDYQYELYREIIFRILTKLLKGEKVNRYKLIDNIAKEMKFKGELYNLFDKWKRDNPETFEQLVIEELTKLYPDFSTF
jgi:hypothetical protein